MGHRLHWIIIVLQVLLFLLSCYMFAVYWRHGHVPKACNDMENNCILFRSNNIYLFVWDASCFYKLRKNKIFLVYFQIFELGSKMTPTGTARVNITEIWTTKIVNPILWYVNKRLSCKRLALKVWRENHSLNSSQNSPLFSRSTNIISYSMLYCLTVQTLNCIKGGPEVLTRFVC